MTHDLFIAAFITLFVVVDPVGTAAVFSVMTRQMTAVQSRAIAFRAVVTALALYAFFGLCGFKVLEYMGISLTAFRMAGGLLLFVTAFRMIMGRHDEKELSSDGNVYGSHMNLAVFPLAIPLLAGPGSLTALLLLLMLSHAGGAREILVVVAALLVVQAIALASFLAADRLRRLLGQSLMMMIARVMGILLASMAVQFIIDGVRQVHQTL